MRVKPEPRRWLFIQTSAWFFLLCHRVWWENVKEEDVASYRQLWSCFAERDVMEQSREFSKEIKEGGGKVIKQYRTVFVSQGFLFFYDATPPLLQYNWTKTKTNWYFFCWQYEWKKENKNQWWDKRPAPAPALAHGRLHPSIHPLISRAIHP